MYGPIQTIHVRPKKFIDFIKKKHSPHLSIEYRSYSLHSYHQSHNSHVNKKDGLWERGVFLQPSCHQKIAKAIFYFLFNLTPTLLQQFKIFLQVLSLETMFLGQSDNFCPHCMLNLHNNSKTIIIWKCSTETNCQC